MNDYAILISLKRLANRQYEAVFTYNEHEHLKRFEIIEGNGYNEISIDDRDLGPRLKLRRNTTRALFAFHTAFKEDAVAIDKETAAYLDKLRSPENLARIEKEKMSLQNKWRRSFPLNSRKIF